MDAIKSWLYSLLPLRFRPAKYIKLNIKNPSPIEEGAVLYLQKNEDGSVKVPQAPILADKKFSIDKWIIGCE